jgi:hypothetical protein
MRVDTLLRAANAVGGSRQLAKELAVAYEELRSWMRGEIAPAEILSRAEEVRAASNT